MTAATPALAAQELLDRRNARRSLLAFTERTHPKWTSGKHHVEICDALEALERGDIDRLMVNAPPRSSKTEICSRRFPAWCLGRRPDWQIISATYSDDLARDNGADVRGIVRDPDYQRVFRGTELRADASASGRWRTSQGGIFVAAGVGGGIVGRGANLAIIDDPIKNREDADSPRMKEICWRWYWGAFITRLMPGGRVLLMMTRWSEDDLAGRLLEIEGEKWHQVCLPAIIDEDTPQERALWPEFYDLDTMRERRDSLVNAGRAREWNAQYMQRPTAEEGIYCKREWFADRYDERPEALSVYMASDFAVTEPKESGGRGPDYTEHGVFGMGPDDHVYVLDWWYGRTTSDEWVERWIDLMAKWKPAAVFGEAGVIRRAMEPLLEKRMRERKVYAQIEWVSSISNKTARGRAFQARASMRTWHFPQTPWAERVIEQCVAFPAGTFDDAFDVCSLFGRVVDETHPALVSASTKRKESRWDRAFGRDELSGQGWKVT